MVYTIKIHSSATSYQTATLTCEGDKIVARCAKRRWMLPGPADEFHQRRWFLAWRADPRTHPPLAPVPTDERPVRVRFPDRFFEGTLEDVNAASEVLADAVAKLEELER